MARLEIVYKFDNEGYRTEMTVLHHKDYINEPELIAMHWDNGEPEDNLFGRDYDWIGPLLEKVYNLGKQDASS